MKNYSFSRKQRGFTLFELMIAIVIIAVLTILFVRAMNGNTDGPRAAMLIKTASSITQNFGQVARTCGVSYTVSGNPVPAAGKTALDVVFEGDTAVSSAYQACYYESSVRALRETANRSGSAWKIEEYPVQLTGGGPRTKFNVIYQQVPDEVALAMAQKYNTNLTALAASDTTSDVVRYSAASGGTRTVTVIME